MKKFLMSLKSRIVLFIMQSKFYNWVLSKIIPFIRISFYYSNMRGFKFKRAYKILRVGDTILCKDSWKLTTWLIPGEFSHAALCVDKEEYSEYEIAEMTHKGFTKSTFYDIFRESTRLVILRCKDWDVDYIKKVVNKCKSFEGLSYDNMFEFGIKSLYCSEMIYEADEEKRLIVSIEDLMGLGKPYISPIGIYHAKNAEVVWDSQNEKI